MKSPYGVFFGIGLCVPVLVMNSAVFAAGEPPAPPSLPPIGEPAPVAEILQQMVGCFQVTFSFVEDGLRDQFFQPVFERAELTKKDPITISRTLVLGNMEQPHWSEEWTELEGRTWHQRVIGPEGDFRYECDGTFEVNQWSCAAKGAAKPRRDAAEPYASLDRGNTIQITPKRWIQAENNRKVKADGSLYSVELGWNRYERAADSSCVVKSANASPTNVNTVNNLNPAK